MNKLQNWKVSVKIADGDCTSIEPVAARSAAGAIAKIAASLSDAEGAVSVSATPIKPLSPNSWTRRRLASK